MDGGTVMKYLKYLFLLLSLQAYATDGDFINSFRDSLQIDASGFSRPDIAKHESTVDTFAIVYRGADSDLYVATFECDTVGNIQAAVADSWEFRDGVAGVTPQIEHVGGSNYFIISDQSDTKGRLQTITISAAGDITESIDDALNFDEVGADDHKLFELSDGYYAVVYCDDDNTDKGWIKTFSVNISTGAISRVDSSEFEENVIKGTMPACIDIGGGYIAVLYRDVTDGEWEVKTMSVSDIGVITSARVDSCAYTSDTADDYCSILKLSATEYLVGFVKDATSNLDVFSVESDSTDGSLSAATIDDQQIITSRSEPKNILDIGNGVMLLGYVDGANVGHWETWQVDTTDGSFASSNLGSQDFVATNVKQDALEVGADNTVHYILLGCAALGVRSFSVAGGIVVEPTSPVSSTHKVFGDDILNVYGIAIGKIYGVE